VPAAEWNIRGKTAVITGGNTGIGKATATELVRRGARVVITARDAAKGERAVATIRAELEDGDAPVSWRFLDLASCDSIRDFARALEAELPALDVLIHNAGLILSQRRETVDGIEATFGINHLGPFLLNRLLEDLLRRSAPPRIVVVSSDAHRNARGGLDFDDLQGRRSYNGPRAYSHSKLANILFTRELARRLAGSGVTANCLHPGVVATDFTRDGDAGGLWGFVFKWFRPLMATPEQGARTVVCLACEPALAGTSGGYFARCRPARPAPPALDDAAARRLWEVSEELCEACTASSE